MSFLKKFLAATLFLVPLQGIAIAQECGWDRKIWASERGDDRWTFYFEDSSTPSTEAFLELRRNNELAARMFGVFDCRSSNTACYFTVLPEYRQKPGSGGPDFDESEIVSYHTVEFVRPTENRKDDLLVLVGFRESMWYKKSDHIDTFIDLEGEKLIPPTNYFRFLACRENELPRKPRYEFPFAGLWVKDARFCEAIREAGGPEDLPFTFDGDYLLITRYRVKTGSADDWDTFFIESDEVEGLYRAYIGPGTGNEEQHFFTFIRKGDELHATMAFTNENDTWQKCE